MIVVRVVLYGHSSESSDRYEESPAVEMRVKRDFRIHFIRVRVVETANDSRYYVSTRVHVFRNPSWKSFPPSRTAVQDRSAAFWRTHTQQTRYYIFNRSPCRIYLFSILRSPLSADGKRLIHIILYIVFGSFH